MKNRMKTRPRTILAAAAVAVAMAAHATPSVTINSVVQRWPWNNKVDITYTVADGQDMEAGVYYRVDFTASIGGQSYYIDGVTNVGASASTGRHTVTWKAPLGLKAAGCTMTAAVSSHTEPSGDDYMILDLNTGKVTFEGLLGTGATGQARSNARYNTDTYKTDKMAFRKVPAGGTYYTGDNNGIAEDAWTTDRDFYTGIFMVTLYQYNKIYGSVPSGYSADSLDPVRKVSYVDLRGVWSANPLAKVTTPGTGTFLQRLAYITGNAYVFDLPTLVMSEIAERAGTTSYYWWNSDKDTAYSSMSEYAVYKDVNGGLPLPVGSLKPNAWGLYDTAGNGYEICLGGATPLAASDRSLKSLMPDVFTASVLNNRVDLRGGASFSDAKSNGFRSGLWINSNSWLLTHQADWIGFRIAYVAD